MSKELHVDSLRCAGGAVEATPGLSQVEHVYSRRHDGLANRARLDLIEHRLDLFGVDQAGERRRLVQAGADLVEELRPHQVLADAVVFVGSVVEEPHGQPVSSVGRVVEHDDGVVPHECGGEVRWLGQFDHHRRRNVARGDDSISGPEGFHDDAFRVGEYHVRDEDTI